MKMTVFQIVTFFFFFALDVFYKTRITTKSLSAGLAKYSEINFHTFI